MENYHDLMQCEWEYFGAAGKNELEVHFPESSYPDFSGLIAVARVLMPGVTKINTFVGGASDTAYVRTENGKWLAMTPDAPGRAAPFEPSQAA